jgi:hypothetical protein
MKQAFVAGKTIQLVLGLLIGICFGFLLQKAGVTKYDVILGQLLLEDFTVVKVILTAVITGMVGIYALRSLGLVNLYPKEGSIGATVLGGLIFGVGFAILGYCPGTIAGAVGQGSLDALFGGVVGILFGGALFAIVYERLDRTVLNRGSFGNITFPELFKVNAWIVVIPVCITLVAVLYAIEKFV